MFTLNVLSLFKMSEDYLRCSKIFNYANQKRVLAETQFLDRGQMSSESLDGLEVDLKSLIDTSVRTFTG